MGPPDLYDLAADLLAAAEEALNTVPSYAPALGGAPERSFVAPGPVVLDCCDQLTVNVSSVTQREIVKGQGVNHVGLAITAARCVPVPDSRGIPPAVEAMVAAAEQMNADAWALWVYLHALVSTDQLFEKCCGVTWGAVTPLQTSGGCGGNLLTVTVCFDGYDLEFGT